MHCLHRLILLFSVSALATIQPAVAQFEVSPDHFDDHPIAQTPPSPRAQQKLRERIAEEQALLDNYAGRLAAKAQMVEDFRQDAISAAISGDGAAVYIPSLRTKDRRSKAYRLRLCH
jgi:hypothetical protein